MFSFNLLLTSFASLAMQSAPSPLDGLRQCESAVGDAEKLSCYRTESARLTELQRSGQILITTVEAQRRVAQEEFGRRASTPTTENSQTIDRLETTISSSSVSGSGKRIYALADGSIWEQTDQNSTRITPATGSSAAVRRGTLGSFFIKVGNSPEIRVRRVN